MKFRCPNCANAIEVLPDQPQPQEAGTIDSLVCPSCNSRFSLSDGCQSTTLSMQAGFQVEHFEVRELIGEGAFGSVYKAWDTKLARFVALKLPRDTTSSKASLSQILKEARAASEIRHPNVVTVYEVGAFGDSWYIASELIDGPALNSVLKSREFSARESVELMIPLLRASQVFHDQKVIHRDLKAGNVLLDSQNKPHITDFGLARKNHGPDISVTMDGRIVGTPAYMSPEQARGDVASISTRSDIYSLGVIFYELLTGQRPFHATDSRTLLHRVLSEDPKPLRSIRRSIPPDLETICLKAIQKDPDRRYASAGEMANDLQRFLDGRPIHARPVSSAERISKWAYRNKVAASALIFAVLVLVTSLIVVGLNSRVNPMPSALHHVRVTARTSRGTLENTKEIRWAFAPLDAAREPVESHVIRAEGTAVADVRLAPGDYLVVVDIPGVGFHEVHRTVPRDLKTAFSSSTSPMKFTIIEDSIVELAEIRVPVAEDISTGMVLVAGGDFDSGAEGNPFMPLTQFHISDFWMDIAEISYSDYVRVLGEPVEYRNNPLLPKGENPVVGVSWNTAMHFAEARGCRLPTEFEWEYAATNGGKTTYSWGNAEPPANNWRIIDTRLEALDVRPDGIAGLCSSASEITYSALAPYPGGQMVDAHRIETQFGFVVRGGPIDDKDLDSNGKWLGGPLSRQSTNSRDQVYPRVGFRCVRSARPRLM